MVRSTILLCPVAANVFSVMITQDPNHSLYYVNSNGKEESHQLNRFVAMQNAAQYLLDVNNSGKLCFYNALSLIYENLPCQSSRL